MNSIDLFVGIVTLEFYDAGWKSTPGMFHRVAWIFVHPLIAFFLISLCIVIAPFEILGVFE